MGRRPGGVPAFFFLLLLWPLPAAAQQPPRAVVDVEAGWLLFPDDGTVTEPFGGGAFRVYVRPRISVGAEAAFIAGESHSHTMATGNVTWDVRQRGATAIPFLVAGLGLFQTREQFSRDAYSSYDPSFTAGGGLRARVNDRVAAGAEVRIGWELHLRVNGFLSLGL